MKKLKRDDVMVRSAQDYFDFVLEDYPIFFNWLNADAQILLYPRFASKVFNIQKVQEYILNITEKNQVPGLILDRDV